MLILLTRFLTLDIPPVPLYQSDVKGESVLPHIPIFELLKKFDGKTKSEFPNGQSSYTIEVLLSQSFNKKVITKIFSFSFQEIFKKQFL